MSAAPPARPALSVLDPTLLPHGHGPAEGLAHSIALARHAEQHGYARVWTTEHHEHPALAKATPLLLTYYLARHTERIRVGTGGVMLPHHAPLAVAEQAAFLTALHPDRVDLGLGRAPGASVTAAHALGRGAGPDHAGQLDALTALLADGDGAGAPVRAVPVGSPPPAVWLLGSSPWSACEAARRGLPYAFAHHFGGGGAGDALRLYRERFRPSAALDRPYALVTANVVAADTAGEAARQAASQILAFRSYHELRPDTLLPPDEAAARLARTRGSYPATVICGNPAQVRQALDHLAAETGADELMINTTLHDQTARLRSYRLLADAYASPSAAEGPRS
ncbi:MsnO8 family LLM class oxidoreductase [Streptomyces albidoflavus]